MANFAPSHAQIVARVWELQAQRLKIDPEREPERYRSACDAEKHVRSILSRTAEHQNQQRGWRAMAAAYRFQRAVYYSNSDTGPELA